MAYSMGDIGGGFGDEFDNWTAAPLKGIKKIGAELKGIGQGLSKALAPHVMKSANSMKKAFKDKDRVKGMTSMFSMIGGMVTGPIDMIMSLLDKLGISGPIVSVLDGLMQMFSGTLMEALMPAFQELFDILLSEDTIALVKMLASLFAMFLVPMIQIFSKVLGTMIPIWMNLLNIFKEPLAAILPILAKGIGLLVLAGFIPLVTGIWLVGLAIAALIQLFTGVPAIDDWNAMMLPSIASMGAGFVNIISMQHGGYVPATTGGTVVRVGEGGEGEDIVPESQMKEMTWAIEDNGKKLERIYQALVNQGRLR